MNDLTKLCYSREIVQVVPLPIARIEVVHFDKFLVGQDELDPCSITGIVANIDHATIPGEIRPTLVLKATKKPSLAPKYIIPCLC